MRGTRSWRWWGRRERRWQAGSFELDSHIINELELPHGWLERSRGD